MTKTYLEKLTAHLNAAIEQFIEKERGKGYTKTLISQLKDGDIFVVHAHPMRRYADTLLRSTFIKMGRQPPDVKIVLIKDLDDYLRGAPPYTRVYFDHFVQLRAVQIAIERASDAHKNTGKPHKGHHLPNVWKG